MNEENENQPAPLETGSALPEQRHHRPRRRYPRRRYRSDRFRRDNSGESPNSSSSIVDPVSADAGVETLDGQPREGVDGSVDNGEQAQAERKFRQRITQISSNGSGF